MAANTDKIQYNQLPRPTFRWMKVNYLELDRLADKAGSAYRPEERHDGDVSVNFYDATAFPTSAISKVPMRKHLKMH